MKRILSLFLVVLVVALGYCNLMSASGAKITISVTLTTSASIWVGSSAYNFQSLAADATSISATSIAVRNNSTALVTKWTLSAAVTTGTNPATLNTSWAGSGNITDNNIALQSMFAASRPLDASFATNNKVTLDGTGNVYDDSTDWFIGATGGQNADNTTTGGINVNSEKLLWFRIKMPPSIVNPSQTIDVSITASAI